MKLYDRLDGFFKKHPKIFFIAVLLLTAATCVVLLGGLRDVGLVYKAF